MGSASQTAAATHVVPRGRRGVPFAYRRQIHSVLQRGFVPSHTNTDGAPVTSVMGQNISPYDGFQVHRTFVRERAAAALEHPADTSAATVVSAGVNLRQVRFSLRFERCAAKVTVVEVCVFSLSLPARLCGVKPPPSSPVSPGSPVGPVGRGLSRLSRLSRLVPLVAICPEKWRCLPSFA
jgi:hypothetical protein